MKTFHKETYWSIQEFKQLFNLTDIQADNIFTYMHDKEMLVSSLGFNPDMGCERCRDWEEPDDAYNQGWNDCIEEIEYRLPRKK